MEVKINEKLFESSPSVAVCVCSIFQYCDEFNLPIDIELKSDDCVIVKTNGWTEHMVHKFMYHMKRDYSEMGGSNFIFLGESGVVITVNPKFKIKSYS